MTEITAARVKELRDKTGAGMMDCKKALTEANGDLEAAVDWLRKQGLSAAAKKSGRTASEGLVGVAVSGNKGAVVEVNAETDFVARNETFQEFVNGVAQLALDGAIDDIEALKATAYPGTQKTVDEQLTELIATVGENMSVRRVALLSPNPGVVASYMHNALTPGLGKIGVLVSLETTAPADQMQALGKQLAMHVAATAPQAISRDTIDASLVEREKAVLAEQARASGKPDNIIEKMVEGRLKRYFEEVSLLDQTYVIDGERKIAKVLDDAAKEAGAPIAIAGFLRFALGEGIERKQEDFAAEVASALKN
ncbi:MAG: translation elongation factor Ts [Rhodospirillales bacterium]|jgi:elongation factor Ts|nr:translation elongation factor Ts [Rhodospirillales bacterium]